ncbi:hypothetical protein F5Y11DRAFT_366105 [Daldinia sp. FL1419]|nr:hypothetical protein F5Y11DRAFT_366105 [Daldinia sp. FL1419]
MDKDPKLSLPLSFGARAQNEFNAIIDILASMRDQGTEIPPILHTLVQELYTRAYTAEQHSDRLANKFQRLQAEHTQFVVEYNRHCKDGDQTWKPRAEKNLLGALQRFVDSIIESNRESRDAMKDMFDERLAMGAEATALRKEVAELRRENEALKDKVALEAST